MLSELALEPKKDFIIIIVVAAMPAQFVRPKPGGWTHKKKKEKERSMQISC